MTSALASLLMLPPDRHCDQTGGLAPARAELHRTGTRVVNPCARAARKTIAPGCSVSTTIARFCVAEAAALFTCGRRPITGQRRYQDVFSTCGPLSTIASTSAYRRSGSWCSGRQDIFTIGLLSSAANRDPIYCAIAAYRGSWERPDNGFADAVRTSAANNDAPDFEIPGRTDVNAGEVRSARRPAFHDTAMALPAPPDDHERARLSALFPVKSRPSERSRIDDATSDRPAVEEQKSDIQTARPSPSQRPADGLFVPRSAQHTSP